MNEHSSEDKAVQVHDHSNEIKADDLSEFSDYSSEHEFYEEDEDSFGLQKNLNNQFRGVQGTGRALFMIALLNYCLMD